MLQEYQFTQLCTGGNSFIGQIQALGLVTPGMFAVLFAGLAHTEEDIVPLSFGGSMERFTFCCRKSSCPFLPKQETQYPIKFPHMILTPGIPQMTSQLSYVLWLADDKP